MKVTHAAKVDLRIRKGLDNVFPFERAFLIPLFVSVELHTQDDESSLFLGEPFRVLRGVAEEGFAANRENHCRKSFEDEQPPPSIVPSDAFHESDSVC